MKTLNHTPSVLESLESRLAPAGLVSLTLSASGALTITGDANHNDFQITESGDQWTISKIYDVPGDNTSFKLNGSAQADSFTFAAPLSVKATLGAGNDEMLLNGATNPDGLWIPKTLVVDTGEGNDTVDLTAVRIDGLVTVNMGNGNDYFTAGGVLEFGKGLTVNLGNGANTFDVNTTELTSYGNILGTAGGGVFDEQAFIFKVADGYVAGSLTLKTTTASPTTFEIGDALTDSLVVTKAMTLQSAGGKDEVFLRGDLNVGGLLSMRLGNGDNMVTTEGMDGLYAYGLTYTGGTGVDDFLLEAREVIITGGFIFSGSSGTNILDLDTSEYLGVTKGMTYSGGTGQDTLYLKGPEVFVSGIVTMNASHGANNLGIDATLADLGGLRYTGGNGSDLVEIGQPDGDSELISIAGAVTISLSTGSANVKVTDTDIYGNLGITTTAALGLADNVLISNSILLAATTINMTGTAFSLVEVFDSKFQRDVRIGTGAGNDEVRFDTDVAPNADVPAILSVFNRDVIINLGTGDDAFYAGGEGEDNTFDIGNIFNGYVDVYGGAGFDTTLFMDTAAYNNFFNYALPWTNSVEDYA